MDPQQLTEFIMQRKWVALAAIIIGLVVRLLKSDTKIPIDIPPQYRVWLALALGGVAGVLDKLGNQDGVTWTSALTQGFVAAVVAIVSHNAVIESLNSGRELNIPGLIKPGEPPSPGKPPTIPPAGMETLPPLAPPPPPPSARPKRTLILRIAPVFLAMWLAGCALFTKENFPTTVLTFEQLACIAENAFLNNETLNLMCNLLTAEQRTAGKQYQSATREGLARQQRRVAVIVCATDAGPNASTADASVDGGAR